MVDSNREQLDAMKARNDDENDIHTNVIQSADTNNFVFVAMAGMCIVYGVNSYGNSHGLSH